LSAAGKEEEDMLSITANTMKLVAGDRCRCLKQKLKKN